MRIVFASGFCLLISVSCFAQRVDTVRAGKDPDSASVSQPVVPGQQNPQLKQDGGFAEQDAVKLQQEEVPLFLKRVLAEEQYRGWENGGVYRNIQSNEYRVDVVNGMNRETFYFDKNGTLLNKK
jgi:hypothetical protein